MHISKEKTLCINRAMKKAHLTEDQRLIIIKLLKNNNMPRSIPIGSCYAYTGCYAPFIIGQKTSNKIFVVQRRNHKICRVRLNDFFFHYFKYHRP